jgi:hypothetical protein
VADRRLFLSWKGSTLGATTAHVLIELNGSWVSIGSVDLGDDEKAELDASGLTELDEDCLLSLRASRVRVELRDNQGNALTSSDAPINVDCPADFCGLAMVGPLMATLDERIAYAGWGAPMTYREQLKFLEQQRSKQKKPISVLTHEADLDRFFRNLHSGFKGLRARREALPNSEYTLRRNFKDLGRWCAEAIQEDSKIPTIECRVFLVDRLSREIERVLDAVDTNPKLSERLGAVVGEFEIAKVVQTAGGWARALGDRRIAAYVAGTVTRLQVIEGRIGGLR